MEQQEVSLGTRILLSFVVVLLFFVMSMTFIMSMARPAESKLGYIISFSEQIPVNTQMPDAFYVKTVEGERCLVSPAWMQMTKGSMYLYAIEESTTTGNSIIKVHFAGSETSPYHDCGNNKDLVLNYADAVILADVSGGWLVNGERRPEYSIQLAPAYPSI